VPLVAPHGQVNPFLSAISSLIQ